MWALWHVTCNKAAVCPKKHERSLVTCVYVTHGHIFWNDAFFLNITYMQWESGQLGGTWRVNCGAAVAIICWPGHNRIENTEKSDQDRSRQIKTIEALRELTSLWFTGIKMMEATDFIHSTIHRYGGILLDDTVRQFKLPCSSIVPQNMRVVFLLNIICFCLH